MVIRKNIKFLKKIFLNHAKSDMFVWYTPCERRAGRCKINYLSANAEQKCLNIWL